MGQRQCGFAFSFVISVVEIKASIQKVRRQLTQEARAGLRWMPGSKVSSPTYGILEFYPVDAKVAMQRGLLSGPEARRPVACGNGANPWPRVLTTRIDNFIPLQTGIELKDPFE